MSEFATAQDRATDAATILMLHEGQLLGFKEARSLLETVFPYFTEVRDEDLDTAAEAEEGDSPF